MTSTSRKPKVAVIGTGGTISSMGKDAFDIIHYGSMKQMLQADELVAKFPVVHELAEIIPVRFRAVPSYNIYFPEWKELVLIADRLATEHPDLSGIVITHGTATLEETAYLLHLTMKVSVPVVIVGAQRPASSLSTDAGMNLANAIRTTASLEARGLGVLVMLNDEIQAARDVRKTSTYRMQTFRTDDFGALGHADGDTIAFYRKPLRHGAPDTEFDIRTLDALPRVDIVQAYTGSDGTAVRAFVAAGAKGIVSAGFPPGFAAPGDMDALAEARGKGVVVVQSTRAMSGRTAVTGRSADLGFISADNLTPQKARLLLALALTRTREPAEIARMFATY
jgi:L-asparaginase